MGKLFRNMDSLKAMILICIVASAGLGGWYYFLRKERTAAKRSWVRAKTDVEETHGLLKQISTLYRAKDEQVQHGAGASVYFEKQLTQFGGIDHKAYTIKESKEREVAIGRNRAYETTVDIDFRPRGGGERTFLPRENMFRAMYNCEKNSKRWKLKELRIRNREDFAKRGRNSGYPEELVDEWFVEKMTFVSREPKGK